MILKQQKNRKKIYSFDKGAGIVTIKKLDAIDKTNEQISNIDIINKNPTPTLARTFQNTLRRLKQEDKFTDTEYKKLYPSDVVPTQENILNNVLSYQQLAHPVVTK